MLMKKDEALAQVKQAYDLAIGHMIKDKGLTPVALAWSKTKGMSCLDLSPIINKVEELQKLGNSDGADNLKVALWSSLREVCQKNTVYGMIVISEAWVVVPKKKDIQIVGGDAPGMSRQIVENIRPSRSPHRREAINLSWEFITKDEGYIQGVKDRFFRRNGKEIILEEEISVDSMSGGKATGLAAGFLVPAPPKEGNQ